MHNIMRYQKEEGGKWYKTKRLSMPTLIEQTIAGISLPTACPAVAAH
jgi:hypothetical protein